MTIKATQAVETLKQGFIAGLQHPGDESQNIPPKLIALPIFRATGIPTEMADHFAAEAGFEANDTPTLTAEAAVYTLESAGLSIIPTTELEALRTQAADAPDGLRRVNVFCRCDTQLSSPLMRLTINKTDQVIVDGRIVQACNGVH